MTLQIAPSRAPGESISLELSILVVMSGLTASMGAAPYISLTTYRKDSTGVATPVSVATRENLLFVRTQADSGKAKRIARDPVVQISARTVSGKLKSGYVPATARLMDGGGEKMVRELILAKYGWKSNFPIWQQNVRNEAIDHIGVQITPGGDSTRPEESPVIY
jgi:PPOX class probable F420-dependent enzyme